MAQDWYEIKFLESTTNIQKVLHRSFGRKPNAEIARGITVALQQGRLFFEAATEAPIEIRPLLVYYGVLSFARALTAAISNVKLDNLAHAHGLKDIGTPISIEKLRLRCSGKGTFQEFNDAIAPLSRIHFFDDSMPAYLSKSFDMAAGLDGKEISFTDILSRIPALSKAFRNTFHSASNCLSVSLSKWETQRWNLRIDDPTIVSDRDSLRKLVGELRNNYSFLRKWRLSHVQLAWGNSVLMFDNQTEGMRDDLSDVELFELGGGRFQASADITGSGSGFVVPEEALPPLSGGYDRGLTCTMQPINGVALNEYSLQFLGTFLLGSLVRYRPQIWQHAISKSVTTGSPADDRALSLVEQFIDEVLYSFPRLAVNIIDYKRTHEVSSARSRISV